MLRIAVLSFHGCPLASPRHLGGMQVYIRELSRELGRRGLAVDVFTRWHDPALPQIEKLGDETRVIHLKAGEGEEIAKESLHQHLPEFLASLSRFQEKEGLGYDLLHSHYWLSGLAAVLSSWKVPHIAMFHTLGQMIQEMGRREGGLRIETERAVMDAADRVVAPTRSEKRLMAQRYGVPPGKIQVIPCGVDLNFFRPLDKVEARMKLGLSDPRILLFVGRIDPVKRLDLLLKALSLLPDQRGTRLLIVGGDPQSEEVGRLRSLAGDLGIRDQVTFRGAVGRDRLPLLYSAADIFVMPSRYESFGMAALEALACGTPVVASRVGGLKSIVRHGETGYLVAEGRPEPLARRMESLLKDEALRGRFAQAAKPSVERFGWPHIAERTIKLYDAVIKARKNQGA